LSRFVRRRAGDWISLGEASDLLGVAPGTLRRWSDDGRVGVFTTPGGHRRYRRSALERLVAEESRRPALRGAGLTGRRLARAYRQEARAAARAMPWLVSLTGEQREWFRTHGRRLAESLLAHLDADAPEQAAHQLTEATAEAAGYGRMASALGLSLGQTVEGFLQFRRPFLHELSLVARRRGFDTTSTTELIEAAERAMDRLLVATMTAHSVERVAGETDHREAARVAAGPADGES
jgi:excisionase family DNA binding protein